MSCVAVAVFYCKPVNLQTCDELYCRLFPEEACVCLFELFWDRNAQQRRSVCSFLVEVD